MNKIEGTFPNNEMYENAYRLAHLRFKNNPTLVVIPDIESGFPIVMTKCEHERFMRIYDSLMSKIDTKSAAKIMIFGTGGDMDKGGKSFEDLFYKI